MAKDNQTRVNEEINAPEVRLIDASGNQVGIVPISEAMDAADEAGFDLVEIVPDASPPVCKLLDIGKFRYDQQKRQKENKKKQHVIVVKEVRLRPNIGDHDLLTKANQAIRFLTDGSRLKISVFFRGRENARRDLGEAVLNRMLEMLSEYAEIEKSPTVEGNNMSVYMLPK